MEVVADGLPGQVLEWQIAPLTARAELPEQSVDDRAKIMFSFALKR
ncbi:hypothetical protein GGR92_002710 [Spirosoma lacussanchae]